MARTHRQRGAPRRRPAGALPDVLGLAWVVLAGVAVLVPALAHGASLGTFDQLTRYGLSQQTGTVVHYTGPGDQIEMLIPWTSLAWAQVHAGHLPLWNQYSALGMPLAFNWQSAAFSVPTLIGYLFPLRLAFTVVQIVTVVVAGAGTYVLGRVLRLGVVGATTAAVVFELSGPFVGWLGWPNSSALSWAGWLLAATVMLVEGRRRTTAVVVFALSLAAAIYAGQPETVVLLALAIVVVVAVLLLLRGRAGEHPGPLRPVGDLALATVAGAALAAPLALPGLQLAQHSVVRVASSYGALAPHNLANVLFQGFDGLPVAGSRYFGNSIYPETAVYVGVTALALAVVAVGTRWRRPVVPAFAACALVMGVVAAYAAPVVSVIDDATGLRSVAWHRSVQPMVLALAVLAGIGMDAVDRAGRDAAVRRWALGAFAGCGLVLLALWTAGRGTLPHAESVIRAKSFLWPLVLTAVGLAVGVALVVAGRRAHTAQAGTSETSTAETGAPQAGGADAGAGARALSWAAAVLLASETAFLVAAAAPLASSSPAFTTPTPAERALAHDVGGSLVAFGGRDCHTPPTLGIHQNINVVYGVHELADFDPMIPEATFRSFQQSTGQHADARGAPLILCPAVDDAATARLYGVGYILTFASSPAPAGTAAVARIAGERLWRVPGSAMATLTALGRGGTMPARDASGRATPVRWTAPNALKIHTAAGAASALRFRVTAVPGWQASIDGRPLRLSTFAGTMLQARIPPGRHVVTLSYWPTTFTAGLVVGALAVVGLVAVPGAGALRRRSAGAVTRARPRHGRARRTSEAPAA